jgi:type I restriction enzyme S subunit
VLKALEVPVPPSVEQDQIVDLLSRAENIVRMRREAEQRAKEIIPALFLDVFGDPATNPKGWAVASLGSLLLDGPKNGLYKHASLYGEGTPILRIDSFYDGAVVDLADLRRVRISAEEKQSFALQSGDIVVNRVNSPEYLGKSAIVPKLSEPTVFESNMMRLRLNTEIALPEYAIQLIQLPSMRRALIVNAKHAINQSSINQTDVKALQLVVPPVALQGRYVAQVRALVSLDKRQRDGSAIAALAFQSLLAGVFGE